MPIDNLEACESRYDIKVEKPARDTVADLSNEAVVANVSPEITKGNILGTDANLVKRKEMLSNIKQEPVDFAFERAIGNNDSVYSNFVELIANAKRKVGRIAVKQGNKNMGFATGFMVAENLLLTNWHVFKTIEEVADSEIQFFYELNTSGNPGVAVSFKLRSNQFYHSNKELDYSFVAVEPVDITGKIKLSEIGYIFLDPGLGKLGNEGEEALNIIHHPDGDYKQLSIRENTFTKITSISIWYKTDTAPGSSGSPVFNDQWQVVALHHSGVAKRNDAGDYIDREGKVIPRVNGQIDTSKVVWIANEGIRISVILKDLFKTFPNKPILKGLKTRPIGEESLGPIQPEKEENDLKKHSPEKETTDLQSHSKNTDMETGTPDNNINISFPASLIEKNGFVNITINQGGQVAAAKPTEKEAVAPDAVDVEDDEIKKQEDTVNFSLCKGYQTRFLGTRFDIAMPQPKKEIKKFIAKIKGTDSVVLKYFNYSVIHHSVRMMPIISGVNVDGDPAKRKDDSERKDIWLRDKRLGFDIQLDDTYYKNSGFDRGHMSRREDANWGATPGDAKRNADLTCMHTNACPQVARINQSSKKGLWGILEKVVLEQGAKNEDGKTARISVFNGPVFKEADPVYKGIQVPLDFFKIVLWLTDKGDLKATAFKLSQLNLVGDIDFEQLDLDQNIEFKAFQCSIKSLDKSTGIDFSQLFPFDTFSGTSADEIEVNSEIQVMAHLTSVKKKPVTRKKKKG